MRRRWYYWKRTLRTGRPLLAVVIGIIAVLGVMTLQRNRLLDAAGELFQTYGVQAVSEMMKTWLPGIEEESGKTPGSAGKTAVLAYLEELAGAGDNISYSEDPAYERMLAKAWERDQEMTQAAAQETEGENAMQGAAGEEMSGANGTEDVFAAGLTAESISVKPTGSVIIREKLADYDYLMKNFYSVHPTTTAGRDMMSAEKFLTMDLSIEKNPEEPQILIYHTHSQEEFADYPENKDATIIGVGTYLADLLEGQGYKVIHDTSVYDVRDGKLDRSQAYTYALEGITAILQKYPSIEVVLDIHRDGVAEETKLVTEVNGKPTAKIMFFNGTSQTPDGPIEYLPNPNRDANMAFSFQMQLLASEQYPDYTRKIYLKGLRYNQHVRARTALIEVGAQTNTYAEVLNAMEPLADLLSQVLEK